MTYRWCFMVVVCHALVFREVRVPAPYWPSTRCVQVVHKTPVGFQHKLHSKDLISLFLTVRLHTLITWTAFRTVHMMLSTGLHLTYFIFAHPDVFLSVCYDLLPAGCWCAPPAWPIQNCPFFHPADDLYSPIRVSWCLIMNPPPPYPHNKCDF